MAVFSIADLHLSVSGDHSMTVFGARWQDYMEKIKRNWPAVVSDDDTVIIPGDISWAMTLSEAREDFAFLDALPGKKLLSKGNHDFWWETATKLGRFFDENGFHSLSILYNNAFVAEDFIVCGTRGWFLDEEQQQTVGKADFAKMVNREVQRLAISLEAAARLRAAGNADKEILCFLHFPPVWGNFSCPEILSLLKQYGVKRCFYGHIHGQYHLPATRQHDDLTMTIVASDYLGFSPYRIFPLNI